MQVKNIYLLFVLSSFSLLSFTSSAAPVNVNTASAEQIASSLKGIGPAKAQAISDFCQKTSCSKPDDLLQVKGIGAKTLAKIETDLRFKDDVNN